MSIGAMPENHIRRMHCLVSLLIVALSQVYWRLQSAVYSSPSSTACPKIRGVEARSRKNALSPCSCSITLSDLIEQNPMPTEYNSHAWLAPVTDFCNLATITMDCGLCRRRSDVLVGRDHTGSTVIRWSNESKYVFQNGNDDQEIPVPELSTFHFQRRAVFHTFELLV